MSMGLHGDIEPADIVEAEEVVHVVVREQDGVGPPEIVPEGLCRSGPASSRTTQGWPESSVQHGGPVRARVARVGATGVAGGDDRHAAGRAGAEKRISGRADGTGKGSGEGAAWRGHRGIVKWRSSRTEVAIRSSSEEIAMNEANGSDPSNRPTIRDTSCSCAVNRRVPRASLGCRAYVAMALAAAPVMTPGIRAATDGRGAPDHAFARVEDRRRRVGGGVGDFGRRLHDGVQRRHRRGATASCALKGSTRPPVDAGSTNRQGSPGVGRTTSCSRTCTAITRTAWRATCAQDGGPKIISTATTRRWPSAATVGASPTPWA